jgi:hypothetical protein
MESTVWGFDQDDSRAHGQGDRVRVNAFIVENINMRQATEEAPGFRAGHLRSSAVTWAEWLLSWAFGLPSGEQLAMSHLFAGAFGVYRNSTGHRHVEPDAADAAEVIVDASQLLRTVGE